MVKTLRITGIVVVILAVILLALLVFFGIDGDKKSGQAASGIDVIEKFRKSRRAQKDTGTGQDSPLVAEAEKFALYLNPPAKPTPPVKKTVNKMVQPTIRSERRPEVVSAKFNLIGTSFFASHPEKSLALIDQPGDGLRWVRQSSKVGHLVIDQVKDGVVVVKDGQRSFELTPPPKPQKVSLIKGEGPEQGAPGTIMNPALQAPPAGEEFEKALENLKKQSKNSPGAAALQSMMEQIRKMEEESKRKNKSPDQRQINRGGASFKRDRDNKSRSGSVKVDSSESRNLDKLGQELEKVRPPRDINERLSTSKYIRRTRGRKDNRSTRINRNPKVQDKKQQVEEEQN